MQTTIELPPPVEMTMPFSQVLGRRRSRREFSDQSLDLPLLSTLLWACAGQNGAETNALKLLAEGDHRSATTAGQDFVHSAPVTLIFAVNQAKTERISGGRAGAICQSVDVGVMVQNALLACSAMGLAAVPRAWFEPQTVLQALGLTSYDPQMAVTVGFPK